VCDGAALECPTGGTEAGCTVELATERKVPRATCTAQFESNVAARDTACEADGLVAVDGSTGVTGRAEAVGEQVVDSISKRLKFRKRKDLRKRTIKLKLNARGRALLESSPTGTLLVRLSVRVRNGERGTKQILQLLNYRR
jgi:hypothetical protein